jgi:hypothetical protein
MPIILRIIAQRIILVALSSITVLGLGPQIDNQSTSEEQPVFEEEKSILERISFPLPKTNILNLPEANSTKPEDTKTTPPIIPKEPTKTSFIDIPSISPKIKTITEETERVVVENKTQEKTEEPKSTVSVQDIIEDNSETNSIENVSVNILCVKQSGNKTSLTTGSGVIISSSGVVLTNAHVAQYFLLKDSGYNCTLRRENIPLYGFNAKPLYISESWIENNYKQITSSAPTGTGKYDYALLLITGNTNPTIPLPKFPSLKLNTTSGFLDTGNTITVSGYPGVVTYSLELAKNGKLQTEKVKVREIFTLGNNTIDVVSSTDTFLAQRGSSGGGVFKNNELGGIIVSVNNGSSLGKFVVNILTLDYINREIKDETGKSLSNFVSGDLLKASTDFETDSLPLKALLMRNL